MHPMLPTMSPFTPPSSRILVGTIPYVVGLSMGGGIATAFAVQSPHLVNDKVAFVASGGIMESTDMSRTAKFMSSPLVQSLSSLPPFWHYMRILANGSSSSELEAIKPVHGIVRLQSAHLPHLNAAVASSLRGSSSRPRTYLWRAF
ncbi:hypothetical protein OG21DRAFT_1220008 [Imleria badia]|nr:hypothetical protein OG21DRAFT_1220008 [Imleria badia]